MEAKVQAVDRMLMTLKAHLQETNPVLTRLIKTQARKPQATVNRTKAPVAKP